MPSKLKIGQVLVLATLAAPALAATQIVAEPAALAKAMSGPRIVLLGEVHDNAMQHALRIEALRLLVAGGARPAIAFEQFDRERQAQIDQARRERPGDAAHLIAQAKAAPGWNWDLYRPFVQLALDHDLPIVAANLSRGEAMKIATAGAAGRPGTMPDTLPAKFLRAHEAMIAEGHCNLLPPDALPGMAKAQIARDEVLAAAIRPHFERGVVLLAGNGHVRTDIGIPYWFTPEERASAISIGLLERGDGAEPDDPARFDAVVMTARAERPDPCEDLRKRMGAGPKQ